LLRGFINKQTILKGALQRLERLFLVLSFLLLTTMVVKRKSNFLLGSGLQGDHLKDLDVNGKTIFKLVLKNRVGGQGQDLYGAE
jgi:hypothetical protein